MEDFKKVLSETKTQLKGMLTKESTQDQIAVITELDKKLDSLNEAFDQKAQENESLKDNLIEAVKNTGFKVSGANQEDDLGQNQKPLEDILDEELQKVIAQQSK